MIAHLRRGQTLREFVRYWTETPVSGLALHPNMQQSVYTLTKYDAIQIQTFRRVNIICECYAVSVSTQFRAITLHSGMMDRISIIGNT